MASPSICKSSTATFGFSLVETILVVLLVGVLLAATWSISPREYQGRVLLHEQEAVLSLLREARGRAMHNVCEGEGCRGGETQGVVFFSTHLVLFQGNDYASRQPAVDRVVDVKLPVSASNASTGETVSEIVFAPLSGQARFPYSVSIAGEGETANIYINEAGRISRSE